VPPSAKHAGERLAFVGHSDDGRITVLTIGDTGAWALYRASVLGTLDETMKHLCFIDDGSDSVDISK
jgi:hypothetical protein